MEASSWLPVADPGGCRHCRRPPRKYGRTRWCGRASFNQHRV